ncbi:hypothetical protein ACFV06_23070 [Streptomyces sp. NPDC059618]|uniref:hypothetical protein n=1 Tax=Streptomyces sp. NPDC059618 TaxID=3346887 RepID=UPI00369F6913
MNTDVRRTLPATAIPDGCLPWSTEHTQHWTRTLPPVWASVQRLRVRGLKLALLLGVLAALGLISAGVPPYLAAVAGLHLVWLPLRPEIVRVSAPALAVAVLVVHPAPVLPVIAGALALTATALAVSGLRLRARDRQRDAALAASGGVTAPVPDAGGPLRRGRFLSRLGILLVLAGVPLIVTTAGLWDSGEGRRAVVGGGCFVAGLGVTALLSGVLGGRRATALRAAPAPVLRVLTRETRRGGARVFAADDVAGLRPLFTVGVVALDHPKDYDGEDVAEGAVDALADATDIADPVEAANPLFDDRPGPLREAVLYGAPYDGAEVVLVSAAAEPGGTPVAERSSGPVRPVPEAAVRWRLRQAKRTAARRAAEDAEHRGLVEAARRTTVVPVRRWRAGAVDRLAALLMMLCGVAAYLTVDDGDSGLWQEILVALSGLFGAFRIPVKLRWRITADRTGLWLNGLRRTTHVPWDDFRSARREDLELKLRWSEGGAWTVSAPRWARLQRRRGVPHPYDALAAEVTAMHTDRALRPTGDSEERERGRPLWPLAVPFVLAWLAAAVTVVTGLPRW